MGDLFSEIKFTPGFVLNLLITFVAIISAFLILKNETFIALTEIGRQEKILIDQQRIIIDMRMDILKMQDDQAYFHKQYNEDMNRYIREKPRN